MKKKLRMASLIAFLFCFNKITYPDVHNSTSTFQQKEHYDWIFDGGIQPKLHIFQMLDNSELASETYFLGLVECIHLKGYFEATVNTIEELEMMSKVTKETGERLKRMMNVIDSLDHSLSTSNANYYALSSLLKDRPAKNHIKQDFWSKGLIRYLESEDLKWIASSDRAVFKQALALDALESCAYHEKQLERLLTND